MARIAINAHLLSFDKTFRNTGVSRYIYKLIEYLIEAEDKNEYVIFMSRKNWKPGIFPSKKNIQFCLTRFNTQNPYIRILWENIFLPFLLLFRKIDIYHSPLMSLPLFCPVKSVVTIFDLTMWIVPETHKSHRNFYLRYGISHRVKKSKAVIVNSHCTKADVANYLGIRSEHVYVIHLAASDEISYSSNLNLTRRKYGLPDRFMLHLSTIEPRKNISRLLEAFSVMLKQKKIDISLVIAGPRGWKAEQVYAKVKEYELDNKVIFTGFIDENDLPFLYSAAELFVYVPLYEGFGIPVLEAMKAGTPVITSNTSAMPETGGYAAYYVNPYNVYEIASSIEAFLSDDRLRQDFIKKGYKHVKKFSWEKMALQTVSIYEQVSRDDCVCSKG